MTWQYTCAETRQLRRYQLDVEQKNKCTVAIVMYSRLENLDNVKYWLPAYGTQRRFMELSYIKGAPVTQTDVSATIYHSVSRSFEAKAAFGGTCLMTVGAFRLLLLLLQLRIGTRADVAVMMSHWTLDAGWRRDWSASFRGCWSRCWGWRCDLIERTFRQRGATRQKAYSAFIVYRTPIEWRRFSICHVCRYPQPLTAAAAAVVAWHCTITLRQLVPLLERR